MAWLTKWHNAQFEHTKRVYKSGDNGYLIRASDYASGGTPPDGWQVAPETSSPDEYVLPWVQPTGAHDAYQAGAVVRHEGQTWRSTVNANVWEPGVSGWQPASSLTPAWVQPTGAHDAYAKGVHVSHAGKVWVSLVDANVWEPGVSGWREALLIPFGLEAPAIPAWVQPTGGHDAYALGALVMHKGQKWRNTVANNVWEPGVHGWVLEP